MSIFARDKLHNNLNFRVIKIDKNLFREKVHNKIELSRRNLNFVVIHEPQPVKSNSAALITMLTTLVVSEWHTCL